ncbi:hypothetical protein ACFFRR_004845 [Megaselia abdita]
MKQKLILTVLTVVSIALSEVHGDTRFFLRPPIISGENAYLGQFPWQVILKKDLNDELLCGGSIISSNWVLTAAHCTSGRSSVVVAYGTVDRDDLSTYQVIGSSGIFVHPQYDAKFLSNDVSLINLPSSLTFNSYVQPIRLNTDPSRSLVGQVATIVGFGVMDDEDLDYSENMKYAATIIRDNSVCDTVYPSDYVTSNTVCAEPLSGNQNICSGDSGGPLIIQDGQGYIQVGINSFVVEDECTKGYPSGFVRMSSFISYVSSITGLTF